jgi:hypothetical protein
MPVFNKDVTVYDVEVEIELDNCDIADEYNRGSDFSDLMDTLTSRHPTHMADWLVENADKFGCFSKYSLPPQCTLTDQQCADLDRAANILDALQTLLGLGDASTLAMRLREIKVTYVEMIQA